MATSLIVISIALVALLGKANSMAIDGARSLSCCGRANSELQSDHTKLEAAQKKNERVNLKPHTTELQNSTLDGAVPTDQEDRKDVKAGTLKQQQKKKCARSVDDQQQNDQLVNIKNKLREHLALRDLLINSDIGGRKSIVKQQTNREIIDSSIQAENLDLNTKRPVPPEPLTALKQLVAADEKGPDKYVNEKTIESALKEKSCDKKKKE